MVTNVVFFLIKGRCSLVCPFVWKRDPSRNEFRPAVVRTIVFNALSVQGSSRRYRKCFCGCPERKKSARRGASSRWNASSCWAGNAVGCCDSRVGPTAEATRGEISLQFFRFPIPEKFKIRAEGKFYRLVTESLEFWNFTFSIRIGTKPSSRVLSSDADLAATFHPQKLGRPNTNFVTVLP